MIRLKHKPRTPIQNLSSLCLRKYRLGGLSRPRRVCIVDSCPLLHDPLLLEWELDLDLDLDREPSLKVNILDLILAVAPAQTRIRISS